MEKQAKDKNNKSEGILQNKENKEKKKGIQQMFNFGKSKKEEVQLDYSYSSSDQDSHDEQMPAENSFFDKNLKHEQQRKYSLKNQIPKAQNQKSLLAKENFKMRRMSTMINQPGSAKSNKQMFRNSQILMNVMSPQNKGINLKDINIDDASSNGGDTATLMITDLDFFEIELNRYQQQIEIPLLEKRANIVKNDLEEELQEVLFEVSQIESHFKKTLRISQSLLSNSKEFFSQNQELQNQLDSLKDEFQMIQNQNQTQEKIIKQSEDIQIQRQNEQNQMEKQLLELKSELLLKDEEILEKDMEISKLLNSLAQEEKKLNDNLNMIEGTVSSFIDISNHPNYKQLEALLKEKTEQFEDLKLNLENVNKEFDKQSKKSVLILQSLIQAQQENQAFTESVEKYKEYLEKAKAQRNEYKLAWEKTETKLAKSQKDAKDRVFELELKMRQMAEQISQFQNSDCYTSRSVQKTDLDFTPLKQNNNTSLDIYENNNFQERSEEAWNLKKNVIANSQNKIIDMTPLNQNDQSPLQINFNDNFRENFNTNENQETLNTTFKADVNRNYKIANYNQIQDEIYLKSVHDGEIIENLDISYLNNNQDLAHFENEQNQNEYINQSQMINDQSMYRSRNHSQNNSVDYSQIQKSNQKYTDQQLAFQQYQGSFIDQDYGENIMENKQSFLGTLNIEEKVLNQENNDYSQQYYDSPREKSYRKLESNQIKDQDQQNNQNNSSLKQGSNQYQKQIQIHVSSKRCIYEIQVSPKKMIEQQDIQLQQDQFETQTNIESQNKVNEKTFFDQQVQTEIMINEKECKEIHVQTENVDKIKKDVNEQTTEQTHSNKQNVFSQTESLESDEQEQIYRQNETNLIKQYLQNTALKEQISSVQQENQAIKQSKNKTDSELQQKLFQIKSLNDEVSLLNKQIIILQSQVNLQNIKSFSESQTQTNSQYENNTQNDSNYKIIRQYSQNIFIEKTDEIKTEVSYQEYEQLVQQAKNEKMEILNQFSELQYELKKINEKYQTYKQKLQDQNAIIKDLKEQIESLQHEINSKNKSGKKSKKNPKIRDFRPIVIEDIVKVQKQENQRTQSFFMNSIDNPMADIFNGEKNRTFSVNYQKYNSFNDEQFLQKHNESQQVIQQNEKTDQLSNILEENSFKSEVSPIKSQKRNKIKSCKSMGKQNSFNFQGILKQSNNQFEQMDDINLDAEIEYQGNMSDYEDDRGNGQTLAITQIVPQVPSSLSNHNFNIQYQENSNSISPIKKSYSSKFIDQGRTFQENNQINPLRLVQNQSDKFGGRFERASSVYSNSSSSLGIRKDPNLEFFQMILLSYKMNNQGLDEVMELDHKQLFKKCTQDEKRQFNQFIEWIDKEISRIRFKKAYKQNKKRLERNKTLLNKLEAMDGIKHVKEVKILQNYFDY